MFVGDYVLWWGRKDGFPGADGSTIQQIGGNNASTIPIYGANGNILTEGSTGVKLVMITTSGVLNGNTAQVYAIKNPLVFIYGGASLYDWYTDRETYQDNTLWGDGEEKSAYDPCPKGWRVLTDSEKTYGDFSTTTMTLSGSVNTVHTGRIYNDMAWFPATGYRTNGSLALRNVGGNGYCWSASVSGPHAKALDFNTSGVGPGNVGYRTFGFPIRCVQE